MQLALTCGANCFVLGTREVVEERVLKKKEFVTRLPNPQLTITTPITTPVITSCYSSYCRSGIQYFSQYYPFIISIVHRA